MSSASWSETFDSIKQQKPKGLIEAHDSQVNALASAVLSAPGVGRRNGVLMVDASFSDSTKSGLLQVKSGAVVIDEKYIHGAGALDYDHDVGRPANLPNEAVTAELAAGGVGVTGKVSIKGFWVYESH